jgi:hypothetical protein
MCPIIRSVNIPRFSLNCGTLKVRTAYSGLCSCRDMSSPWMWTVSRARARAQARPSTGVEWLSTKSGLQGELQKGAQQFVYISRQWTSSPSQLAKTVPNTACMITRTGTSDSGLIAPYRQRRAFREMMCAIQNISGRTWRDLYTLLRVYFWRLASSGISRHAVC